MRNQFTEGPWRVHDNQIESMAVPPDEYGNQPTVLDLHGAMGGENVEADARLIAAAPQLYEALRKALGHLQLLGSGQPSPYSNSEVVEIVGAALALVEESQS